MSVAVQHVADGVYRLGGRPFMTLEDRVAV
jgi:hypothetical protein